MKKLLLLLLLGAQGMSAFAQSDVVGSGRAIFFDGVDDYVDLGNIYDDIALPLTLSAWIYVQPEQKAIQYPIFDSQDNLPTYNGFTLLTSTLPHVGFSMGDGKGGNNPAFRRARAGYFDTMGSWVYLTAVARSGNDIRTYMNGIEVSAEYQGTSPYPMNSYSPTEVAKIGYMFGNGTEYWFKGMMDELRIWNRALTDIEIRESMCKRLKGNESGLIGYWNFDETSGDKLKDLSPNKFDGLLKGNPKRVFSGAPVGDESVFVYTTNWSGRTLQMDVLSVSKVLGQPSGMHIYRVNHNPSQTNGLQIATIELPYYGVFLAGDDVDNTFEFEFSDTMCSVFAREDNSEATWNSSDKFFQIDTRIELIRGLALANLELEMGEDVFVCDNESFWVKPSGLQNAEKFLWSTGETTPDITVRSSGVYWLEASKECVVDRDSIIVTFSAAPPSFSLGEDELTCNFEPRILTVDVDPTKVELTWNDGSHGTSYEVGSVGTYWLKVENECGIAIDSITFLKPHYSDLKTYNFISPDTRDEFNQYFVLDERLLGATLSVFNRWGKQVYSATNYQNNWDGSGLAAGLYFYTVVHECAEPVKGVLTLMR